MSKRSRNRFLFSVGFSEDSESEGEGRLRTYTPCGFSFSIFFLLVVFSWIAIEFCQRLLHDSFLCITLLQQRKTARAIAHPNDGINGGDPWETFQKRESSDSGLKLLAVLPFSIPSFFLCSVALPLQFCYKLLHEFFSCITLLQQRKTANAIADPNDRNEWSKATSNLPKQGPILGALRNWR